MPDLIAACAYFLLIHFGVSGTRLRDALTGKLGDRPYRGLFSLASLIGLAWVIFAYRRAPLIATWGLVLGFRQAAYVLVFIAFLFAVIGILTPTPTQVGMESRLDPQMARGMVRITRHPFLWGVGLWAATHLVLNGDVASLILFGTFLVLAIGGTASIDAKRRRKFPERWPKFAQATSNVPFAAIAGGGNRLAPALAEIGAWRIVAALVLYAVAFYLHGRAGHPLV
ncbi:MAG TPA: NnrU family protein [Steroidobacteraceae bacterium]|nr:NnrU family protein [Steroidobacteraceae bacterium]